MVCMDHKKLCLFSTTCMSLVSFHISICGMLVNYKVIIQTLYATNYVLGFLDIKKITSHTSTVKIMNFIIVSDQRL